VGVRFRREFLIVGHARLVVRIVLASPNALIGILQGVALEGEPRQLRVQRRRWRTRFARGMAASSRIAVDKVVLADLLELHTGDQVPCDVLIRRFGIRTQLDDRSYPRERIRSEGAGRRGCQSASRVPQRAVSNTHPGGTDAYAGPGHRSAQVQLLDLERTPRGQRTAILLY